VLQEQRDPGADFGHVANGGAKQPGGGLCSPATVAEPKASTTLSPVLYLFQIPSSTLSQKLQQILSEVVVPPTVETQRRPGPKEAVRLQWLDRGRNRWFGSAIY
jgi:hypothetical protein